ncbi:MAG: hypothetical protein ABJD07_00555 [Gemmatimonadaceae bacterium]
MAADYHFDVMDSDEALDGYQEGEAYDTEEVDDMLDALMSEADADFSERQTSRRPRQRQGVRTATGRSAYQAPTDSGYVSQKQFKEAMSRVGDETRRNAEGIKTVNARMTDVVSVSKGHSRKIGSLDSRMKLDGALDFAQSLTLNTATGVMDLDLSQILRGVVKNGALGDGKGALANPWLIGGIGVLLRNPGIIGGLLGPRP